METNLVRWGDVVLCVLTFIPIMCYLNSFTKTHCLRQFVVVTNMFVFFFFLCILSYVHIALTTCELCVPIIMFGLGLFVVYC